MHDLSEDPPPLVIWHQNDTRVSGHDALSHGERRPGTVEGGTALQQVCDNSGGVEKNPRAASKLASEPKVHVSVLLSLSVLQNMPLQGTLFKEKEERICLERAECGQTFLHIFQPGPWPKDPAEQQGSGRYYRKLAGQAPEAGACTFLSAVKTLEAIHQR